MPTVTVFTAERMQEIEDNTIVNAAIVGDDLVFTRNDGTTVNVGPVLVLTAPNASQYRLIVDNAGNLSTELVV